jgi:hypothetical protein
MSDESDRRAPHVSRIPFEGMVEVGGTLGPSFEAQAVNLSEEGMHLRTAYLPEVGQPVTCRFDAGQGMVVVAAGEVLWNEDMGNGGEFGIRFTNLDAASTVSLQRIVGMVEDGMAIHPPHGRKVRLHIDGLASPMRARIRGGADQGQCVTAFSELGFLQVGKQLDLEDAATGSKRPALIDHVMVEVEQGTRIPQLVVTLRYDDEEAHASEHASMAHMNADAAHDEDTGRDPHGSLSPHSLDDDMDHDMNDEAPHQPGMMATSGDDHVERPEHGSRGLVAKAAVVDEEHDEDAHHGMAMKSAFARSAAKITPALEKWAKRAKTTMALLAARASAKRNGAADDVEIPVRRTTAPAPGGGLHTAGRKVIRGEIEEPMLEEPAKPRFAITKKRAMVGGAIGIASILCLVAMRKPAPAPVAVVPPADTAAAAALHPAAPPPAAASPAMPSANDPLATAAAALGADPTMDGKPGKVTPFGNGPVTHGNVLKIKMDGPVGRIQGASQPSGFTVVIPGRKSLDAAGPLASKDPRIAAIRVSNETGGAELTVTFKDGVPNYQVKAHGDTLEMHLAKPGHVGVDKAPEAHAAGHKKKHHH